MNVRRLSAVIGVIALVGGTSAYFAPVSRWACGCCASTSADGTIAQAVAAADGSPICTLSDDERKDRKDGLMTKVFIRAVETKSLPEGYAFRFAAEDGLLTDLTEMIQAERKCCGFLKFRLDVLPDNGPVWLELTGPEGTKEMMKEALEIKE